VFLAQDTGKQFRFQLQVNNVEGSAVSTVATFVLADYPSKPSQVPTKIQSGSDSSTLQIQVAVFDTTLNGGSVILGY
jgi:hypothetical protein